MLTRIPNSESGKKKRKKEKERIEQRKKREKQKDKDNTTRHQLCGRGLFFSCLSSKTTLFNRRRQNRLLDHIKQTAITFKNDRSAWLRPYGFQHTHLEQRRRAPEPITTKPGHPDRAAFNAFFLVESLRVPSAGFFSTSLHRAIRCLAVRHHQNLYEAGPRQSLASRLHL